MNKSSQQINHFVRNRRILIAVYCFGFAWLVYGIFQYDIEAIVNKNYLNRIVILEGKKTVASARPNGDALTASSAPAYAEFDVNDTLGHVYENTYVNLKRQGYTTDAYADTSHMNGDFYKVAVKFTKGKKNIVLEYNFNESILCDRSNDRQKPCADVGYKDVYGTGLQDRSVSKIKVFYDNN